MVLKQIKSFKINLARKNGKEIEFHKQEMYFFISIHNMRHISTNLMLKTTQKTHSKTKIT